MILRVLLFVLSNIGVWEMLRRKTKIDKAFYPSATIAMQVVILFFAGLLNFLQEATWLIFSIGLFC